MKSRLITVLGAAAILLFGLNGSVFHTRFDLTEGRVYSLSPVTRTMLEELPGEVLITYYRSSILEDLVPGVAEVEDYLRSFASAAGPVVDLRFSETSGEPFSESVGDLDLTPLRLELPREEADRTAYAGVVLRLDGQTVTIPRVLGIDRLEYDLALGLRRLTTGSLPTLVVVEADPRLRFARDFRLLHNRLRDRYNIVVAAGPADVPADTAAFLVLGPDIDPTLAAVVERLLAGGAGALFAFDGADPEDEGPRRTPGATQRLLSEYGIEVQPAIVLDRENVLVPFNRVGADGGRVAYEPYPYWIEVQPQNVAGDHPVTAGFAGLTLFWASPLARAAGVGPDEDGAGARVVAATTDDSWTVVPPVSMEAEAARRSQDLTTSLAIERPLVMAYGGAASQEPRLMVVGDWEFASDLVSAADAGHNLEFVLNALEWTSGDEDLLSIRVRGARDQRIAPAEGAAGRRRRSFVEVAGMVVVPALWFVAGTIIVMRRRRRGEPVQ